MSARDEIAMAVLAAHDGAKDGGYTLTANQLSDAIIAALRAAGYALVPVEPTEAMKHAGRIMNSKIGEDMAEACYRAMISAAKEQT